MSGFAPLPELPQASVFAGNVDTLFFAMVGLGGLILVTLYLLITVFALRYRASSDAPRREPEEEHALRAEVLWTVIPVLGFIGLFVWSARLYLDEKRAPDDAIEVYVVAKQWMWKFQHPDGRRELNELHVPSGTPVRLTMTSQDVIHSFFVPAFRIKQDVLPGRYERIWFEATKTGRFHLLCAEFCGTQHSQMRGDVVVQSPERYAAWLERGAPRQSLAGRGAVLFLRHGCSGCHVADSPVEAPLLAGLGGRRVRLADGRTVVADDDYLRDSILLPDKDVVAGFEPIMPGFTGVLDESEVIALVAYLHALEPGVPADTAGTEAEIRETATEHAAPERRNPR